MTPIKDIKPTNIQAFDAISGQVISLSWGIRHNLHKFARARVHELHVFDYDKVSIIQHKPPKLKGTTKLYESKFDVILSSGKKIKHSVCGISLTKDSYVPHIT